MSWLYYHILYQPIYNLLILFYNIVPWHDMGLAIIAITILIKLVFYPLSASALKSQKALQDLNPKMEELKKKYKDKKEELGQAMMKLYKENKINPLSSCLPLLIQLPFLITVYQVFRQGLTNEALGSLYPFITNPGSINPVSFGFLHLGEVSYVLAILSGVAQFFQTNMLMSKKAPATAKDGAKDENLLASMNKSMKYFMPIMTIVIGVSLPSGLTLYWFLTTLLTIAQQQIMLKRHKKNAPTDIIDIKGQVK